MSWSKYPLCGAAKVKFASMKILRYGRKSANRFDAVSNHSGLQRRTSHRIVRCKSSYEANRVADGNTTLPFFHHGWMEPLDLANEYFYHSSLMRLPKYRSFTYACKCLLACSDPPIPCSSHHHRSQPKGRRTPFPFPRHSFKHFVFMPIGEWRNNILP